jgi:hypothetical protein
LADFADSLFDYRLYICKRREDDENTARVRTYTRMIILALSELNSKAPNFLNPALGNLARRCHCKALLEPSHYESVEATNHEAIEL